MSLIVVVEGDTDLPVVGALAADAGLEIETRIDCGGKHRLDARFPGYNASATGSPWFVLRDLDDDAPCAPAFLGDLGVEAAPFMCLRIAVREMESWLLADASGFASYFGVEESEIPEKPDAIADPTRTIVQLARRSKKGQIRRGVPPASGTSVAVGPLYEAAVIAFGETKWNLERAARRSRSLRNARTALRRLAKRWNAHARGGRRH